MSRSVLLCPPTYFDVIDTKNPYMAGKRPVDHARACAQWEALRRTFIDAGVTVETIEPVAGLEDMVFAANQVFVGNSKRIGRFIVPSRMRFPSRQREVPYFVEWFAARGYRVIEPQLEGEYLEGHGDLIWHPNGSEVYAGYGFRSTRGGVERFAEEMRKLDIPVVPLKLIDERFYHLDTCFCPLNDEAIMLYAAALAREALDVLDRHWQRVHHLTEEEALMFIANSVVIQGRCLVPHLTPRLERILREERLSPVLVDTSEFEKSGGSAFCLKTFI